jgi:DNA-binding transcriptional MerR regulator
MTEFIKKQIENIQSSGKGDQLIELMGNIHEEKYTIGTIGVSHRVLTHWEDKNLLLNPKKSKDEKWRKFDLSSVVWLKIVKELRELKAPLELIYKIKEHISYKYDFVNDPEMRAVFRDMLVSYFGEEEIDQKIFDETAEEISMTLLDDFILQAAGLQSQLSLLINKEGDVFPYRESLHNELMKIPDFLEIFRNHHISISISKIIAEILTILPEEELYKNYQFLTEDELKVLRAIREEDNIKSLLVKFGKKKKVDLIKTSYDQKADLKARLMDLITKNGYHDITLKVENGSVVYCQNTRKTK